MHSDAMLVILVDCVFYLEPVYICLHFTFLKHKMVCVCVRMHLGVQEKK